MKIYQDLLSAKDVPAFILRAIGDHKSSAMYRMAADAEEYDRKRNVTILAYQKLLYKVSGEVVPDNYSANYKVVSGYFNTFMTQETQYLLGKGLTLKDKANKDRLGKDIDIKLQMGGRAAKVQGVSFGFWNLDHLEVFKLTEFAPLYDEENGALMAGIRFWQVADDKPLRATLYEMDGYTEYIKKKGKMTVLKEKRSYKQLVVKSKVDGTKIFDVGNYPGFPIVPFWGNLHHQSELVGLREGIDCYDLIKSGFANDLDDASQIYWTINNAGGVDDVDLATFIQRMKTVRAACVDDPTAKPEAHTLDVPYAAREAMLDRIKKDLYRDAQVLDVEALSASAKTATEIRAAYQPMDNATDGFEYCVKEFLAGIFALAGIEDEPTFTRDRIANRMEHTQMVMMAAQYLDDETILKKLEWLSDEEVEAAMKRKEEMDSRRLGVTTDGFNAPEDGQEAHGAGEKDS